MAILMGVLPGIFLRPMEPAVTRVIERVTGKQPVRVRLEPTRMEPTPRLPVERDASADRSTSND
jgi:hypothetical protein